MPPSAQTSSDRRPARIHWFARLEHRFHAWREKRARKRGRSATVLPFPGYGGPGWIRVVGRVLILPKTRPQGAATRACAAGAASSGSR